MREQASEGPIGQPKLEDKRRRNFVVADQLPPLEERAAFVPFAVFSVSFFLFFGGGFFGFFQVKMPT